MMQSFFEVLVIGAMAATAIVLFLGLATMVRKSSQSGNLSNRLMMFRVLFQAIAIGLFVLVMWLARR